MSRRKYCFQNFFYFGLRFVLMFDIYSGINESIYVLSGVWIKTIFLLIYELEDKLMVRVEFKLRDDVLAFIKL